MRGAACRQGLERGNGMGGSDRLAEQEIQRVSERERSNQHTDFQGKVAHESEKVRDKTSNDTAVFCDKKEEG